MTSHPNRFASFLAAAVLGAGLACGAVAIGSQPRPSRCGPQTLRLSLGPAVSPMTGEHADLFELRNRSRRSCVLDGYPRIRLRYGATRLAFVYARGGGYATRRKPPRVLLAPGHHAYFLVAKYRCDGKVLHTATSILVALPHSRGQMTIALHLGEAGLDYCKRYPGDKPVDPGNRVAVSPIETSAQATQPIAR